MSNPLRILVTTTIAVVALCSTSSVFSQSGIAQESINQIPQYLYENQNFELEFLISVEIPILDQRSSYIVNELNIGVFYEISSLTVSPARPETHISVSQTLSGLPAGEYNIYTQAYTNDPPLDFVVPEGVEPRGSVIIHRGNPELELGLGSPKAREVVGGFGTIRGWACYFVDGGSVPATIGKLTYQVDERAEMPVLYGSPRGDVAESCFGNLNAGFAAPINWNRFSLGEHIFKLFVDGIEVVNRKIIVSGTGETFLRGLDAEYVLDDFPSTSDKTTVRWSQSAQDFTIVDVESE